MPSNEQRRKAAKSKLERQLANRAERARKRRTIGVISTVVGVVVVVGLVYWLSNIGGDDTTADPAAQTSAADVPADVPESIPTEPAAVPKRTTPLPEKATCAYPATPDQPASKPAQAPSTADVSSVGTVAANLKLNGKDVGLTLDRALAPCTVNSFVSLAKQGYFNDTTCHRLTTSGIQVLQCGDPAGTGAGGPGYSFNDETFPEIKYGRGILAMANAGANTNGSQFFMVYGTAELPPSYTVFGTIGADGLKVIDEIAKQGTISASPGQGDGKPKNEVKINEVSIA